MRKRVVKAGSDARRERLAAALRENLKRRKARVRVAGRLAPEPETSESPSQLSDDGTGPTSRPNVASKER